MPSAIRNIKDKVDNILQFVNMNAKEGEKWTNKILPNGHIVILPEEDTKKWMDVYKTNIRETVNNVNNNNESIVNMEKAEEQAIKVVALRAFLRPSKELFQRHVVPGVSWRCISHCWSSFGKTTPIKEFFSPVPGVIGGFQEKIKNLIGAYTMSGLLPPHIREIPIKLAIDGTNTWKLSLETISLSFALLENKLYSNPNNVHTLGLYVGKEKTEFLKKLNFFTKI